MTFAYQTFPFAYYDSAKAILADFPVSSKCLVWVNYDLISQQNKFTLVMKHPEDLYQPYTQSFYTKNLIEWDIALPEALTRFDELQTAIRHSAFEEFAMVHEEQDDGWDTWGEDYQTQKNIGKSIEDFELDGEYEDEKLYNELYEQEEQDERDEREQGNEEEEEEQDDEEEYSTSEDLNSDEKEPCIEDQYDELITQLAGANTSTDKQKIEKIWFSNIKNILYAKTALDSQLTWRMSKE